MSENVNHPKHYNLGRFEVIEIIEDQQPDFHLGNALKYICRAGKKDPTKTIEDLEKALWYVKRKIEVLTAARDGRTVTRPNDMNERKVTAIDPLEKHRASCEDSGCSCRALRPDQLREVCASCAHGEDCHTSEGCVVVVKVGPNSLPNYCPCKITSFGKKPVEETKSYGVDETRYGR